MVSGVRTGSMSERPALNAVATGEQPAAWPPTKRTSFGATQPSSTSSSKLRARRVIIAPDAIGATITSGRRQPRSSAIS